VRERVCLFERRERERENVLGAQRNAKIYCGRKPTSLKMEKKNFLSKKLEFYLVMEIVLL